jgi:hypothetical protein
LPPVSTTLAKLVAKFATGVADTGSKFAAGVVDTGGNLNWIKVKRTEAVFLKLLRSPGIDSEELIRQPM